MLRRRAELSEEEAAALTRFHLWQERAIVSSMERFFKVPDNISSESEAFFTNLEKIIGGVRTLGKPAGDGGLIFSRNPKIKGPMSVFGYDYFTDHYGAEREASIRLLKFQGLRGAGGEYSYEVLNLVDGRRTAHQIRDMISAIYGPISLEVVVEYLRALESIGVIKQ